MKGRGAPDAGDEPAPPSPAERGVGRLRLARIEAAPYAGSVRGELYPVDTDAVDDDGPTVVPTVVPADV